MGNKNTKPFNVSLKAPMNALENHMSRQKRVHDQFLVDVTPPDTSRIETKKLAQESNPKVKERSALKIDINQAKRIEKRRNMMRPGSLIGSNHSIVKRLHKSQAKDHQSGLFEENAGIFQNQRRNLLVERKRIKLISRQHTPFVNLGKPVVANKIEHRNVKNVSIFAHSLVNRFHSTDDPSKVAKSNVKKFVIPRNSNIK